jgi:hypothetical protein
VHAPARGRQVRAGAVPHGNAETVVSIPRWAPCEHSTRSTVTTPMDAHAAGRMKRRLPLLHLAATNCRVRATCSSQSWRSVREANTRLASPHVAPQLERSLREPSGTSE